MKSPCTKKNFEREIKSCAKSCVAVFWKELTHEINQNKKPTAQLSDIVWDSIDRLLIFNEHDLNWYCVVKLEINPNYVDGAIVDQVFAQCYQILNKPKFEKFLNHHNLKLHDVV